MKNTSQVSRKEVGRLLLWLADDIIHKINKDLAKRDLSISKISILWFFAHNKFPEQKIQPSDISKILQVSRAFISKELKQLENKGFIIKTYLDNDKRAAYINVTPEGKDYIMKILPLVEDACTNLTDVFNDYETELMLSLLLKLNKKFENHFIEI